MGGDGDEKMDTSVEELIVGVTADPAPGICPAALPDSPHLVSSPAAQPAASLSTEMFELRRAAAVARSSSVRSCLATFECRDKENHY